MEIDLLDLIERLEKYKNWERKNKGLPKIDISEMYNITFRYVGKEEIFLKELEKLESNKDYIEFLKSNKNE